MNRTNIIYALALCGMIQANAQSYPDALRINQSNYEGTARSQAMGSAFGALGADLTSQSINPAGLAAYRATELGLGFGVTVSNTESNYYGFKADNDKVSVPLNVLGISFNIGNTLRENATGVLNHNVSISYSKLADYDRNSTYKDAYGYNSMLDYFCDDACYNDAYTQKLSLRTVDEDDNPNAAWWLYSEIDDENGVIHKDVFTNVWEDVYWDTAKNQLIVNKEARTDYDEYGNPVGLIDHTQVVNEKGSKGETSFSYALNISNKVYIGTSIGIQSYRYKEEMKHYEKFFGVTADNAFDDFEYGSELKQDGSGVNFKLGAIYVPVTPVRIGFAIHSPTFFSINERYQTWIEDAYENLMWYSKVGDYDYRYRTSSKFIASIAGVIGNYGIISFDYERTDHSKSKFRDSENSLSDFYDNANTQVQNALKATNTFRIGAEARVLESLYLRAGYNMQTSPYASGILIKPFKNDAFSGGFGYRNTNFFVDIAYTCRRNHTERWVLPDADIYEYDPAGNEPALAETKNHKVTCTFGLRF